MPTTQTLTPTTGTDGRVKNRTAGADVIIAGLTSWDLDQSTQVAPVLDFEASASAEGVVFPRDKLVTIGDWKANIAGIYNLNSTATTEGAQTLLKNGKRVILDLVVSKATSVGYAGCTGVISNFKDGQKMGNELCTFTCSVEFYGVPPAFGAVS
jgi:hypothetical protein